VNRPGSAVSGLRGRARERFAGLRRPAAALHVRPGPDRGPRPELRTVEVVVTDFVVAPAALRVLDTVELGEEPG
jgi:hypothetical protein